MSALRRLPAAIVCSAAIAVAASTAAAASGGSGAPRLASSARRFGAERDYLPGEIVVKFRQRLPADGASKATGAAGVDAILQRHAAIAISRIARKAEPPRHPGEVDLTRVYSIRYADGADALQVARELASRPEVEYAEPRFVHKLALVPDDPSLSSQSAYLDKMQFPSAWDVTTGGAGNVVIAVCDGGTDWDHPDLLGNVWNNPGEIPGNGLDDDHNGFIDDVHGWNFTNGTNDPTGLPVTPASANHGTHVAGICCAVANNTTGIAGASYNARFMPLCAASPTTDNTIAYGYDGIVYAAENGAAIINCSWGGPGSSNYEQDVVSYAYQLGTVVVAAAGNDASTSQSYPAAYEHVLAVANVSNTDYRYLNTNYGPWVDVSAQGVNIYSTTNGGGYGWLTGTSMACPHAVAACALVKTHWPGYSPEQVMQRVRVTADNIDLVNPIAYRGNLGYGRVNAYAALTKHTPAISVTTPSYTTSDGDLVVEPGETITLNLTVTNWLAACSGIVFRLRDNSTFATIVDSSATLVSLDSLQSVALPPFTVTISPAAPIQHIVTFTLAISAADPAYTDNSRFPLTVLPTFATHDANNVVCSVTSVGKLGFAVALGGDGADGVGFHFAGSPNLLFEGALLIGTGVSTISDGARTSGASQDDDFQTVSGGTPSIVEPAPPYAEKGLATFTDALATTPLGLLVTQESIESASPSNSNFIVLRYRIANVGLTPQLGLRVGWYCDWDIDGAHFDTNATGYDAARGMMYAYDTSAGGPTDYVGLLTLSSPGTTTARGIWNDQALASDWGVYDGYTDLEKWETLSIGPTHTAVGPGDISIGLATGPFDVQPGSSILVAFAFAGGTDLAALQANADAALAFGAQIPTDAGDDATAAAPRALHLTQNAPNPFNPSTTIAFELPRAAQIELHIYAVDGRLVRTLLDTSLPAGTHQVEWDGRDDAGHAVPSGTYLYRFASEGRSLVRKMQLVK